MAFIALTQVLVISAIFSAATFADAASGGSRNMNVSYCISPFYATDQWMILAIGMNKRKPKSIASCDTSHPLT